MSRHGYEGQIVGRVRVDDDLKKIHLKVGGEPVGFVQCVAGLIRGAREKFLVCGYQAPQGADTTFHNAVRTLCAAEMPLRHNGGRRNGDGEDSTRINIWVGQQRVGEILCVGGFLTDSREKFLPVTRDGVRLHPSASFHWALKNLCRVCFPRRARTVAVFPSIRRVA